MARKRALSQANRQGRFVKRRKKMSDHKMVRSLWEAASNQMYKSSISSTDYAGSNDVRPLASTPLAYSPGVMGTGTTNGSRLSNNVYWQRGFINMVISQHHMENLNDGVLPQIAVRVIIGLHNKDVPLLSATADGSAYGAYLRSLLFYTNPSPTVLNQYMADKDRVAERGQVTILKDQIYQLAPQMMYNNPYSTPAGIYAQARRQHLQIPFSMKNQKATYPNLTGQQRAAEKAPFILIMTDSAVADRLRIELQWRLGFTEDKLPARK